MTVPEQGEAVMGAAGETETINGVPLHYTLDGPDGAPVITFAHALSLDLRSFDAQVPAFSDRYRVLRLDLRGHGYTDVNGGPFSMEDLGDDVAALLDRIGANKTHFVGSSLGAMVGFALALNHPARLASLVFMASQGALPAERKASAHENIAKMRSSGATAETTMAGEADALIARLLHEPHETKHPKRIALLREILDTTTLFGQARAYEAILDMDYDSRLNEIHTPTLVLAGAEDSSTTPERMRMYGEQIEGAQMVLLPGAGHFPNLEQPEGFNRMYQDFLDSLGG